MSIDYHKHCQKTVLSAFGPNGQGATKDVIEALASPLTGLKNLPSGWLELYRENTKNVTEDFAATLKIIDKYLQLSGGTMTGFLTLNANPTQNLHAATKKYVDDQVSSRGTGTVKGVKINNVTKNPDTNGIVDVGNVATSIKVNGQVDIGNYATQEQIENHETRIQKLEAITPYQPPATLSSIQVYMKPDGNDTTALEKFKDFLQNGGSVLTLKTKPFRTIREAVKALNLVRSSNQGFSFIVNVLPGDYIMSLVDSTAHIYNAPAIRHPDCNDFSGSQIIIRGVKDDNNNSLASRGEVNFIFDDEITTAQGNQGVSRVLISLYNSIIQNIRFYQKGLTFDSKTKDILNYVAPCESSSISAPGYIIWANSGTNYVINCECFAKPVFDNTNNKWYSYTFIEAAGNSSIGVYSNDSYTHRYKDQSGQVLGHRSCFYGLNCFIRTAEGSRGYDFNVRDLYFNNCCSIFNSGDSNEYGSAYQTWLNIAHAYKYSAIECDNVYIIYRVSNNTKTLITDNISDGSVTLYNPLMNDKISVIKITNAPSNFRYCNQKTINDAISSAITTKDGWVNISVHMDYNIYFRLMTQFIINQ